MSKKPFFLRKMSGLQIFEELRERDTRSNPVSSKNLDSNLIKRGKYCRKEVTNGKKN